MGFGGEDPTAIDSLLSTKVGGQPPGALTGPAKDSVRLTARILCAYFFLKIPIAQVQISARKDGTTELVLSFPQCDCAVSLSPSCAPVIRV